jgi:hypothetical protein
MKVGSLRTHHKFILLSIIKQTWNGLYTQLSRQNIQHTSRLTVLTPYLILHAPANTFSSQGSSAKKRIRNHPHGTTSSLQTIPHGASIPWTAPSTTHTCSLCSVSASPSCSKANPLSESSTLPCSIKHSRRVSGAVPGLMRLLLYP